MQPGTSSISCAKPSANPSTFRSRARTGGPSTDASECVRECRYDSPSPPSSSSHTSTAFMSFGLRAFHTGFAHRLHFLHPSLTPKNSRTATRAESTRSEKQQQERKKNNPMSPAQLEINVTSPPEDNVCLLGKLCESQSSSSRKVSGGVRLYVGVFSADCTPEMSSRSLQWSQASNLCISSDFFSLSLTHTFVRLLLSSFPSASLSLCLSRDRKQSIRKLDWPANSDCVQHAPMRMCIACVSL